MDQVLAEFEFIYAHRLAITRIRRTVEVQSVLTGIGINRDIAIEVDSLGALHEEGGIVMVLLHNDVVGHGLIVAFRDHSVPLAALPPDPSSRHALSFLFLP